MGRKYKQLSQNDRISMETLLNKGHSVQEVADYLHVHRSTIYREMKRGEYVHRNSDYTEEVRYSSDKGQQTHDWNAQGKGRNIKIGNLYNCFNAARYCFPNPADALCSL